jgi:hypothetical protein
MVLMSAAIGFSLAACGILPTDREPWKADVANGDQPLIVSISG